MSHPFCVNPRAHRPALLIEAWFDRVCSATRHLNGNGCIHNRAIHLGWDDARDDFRLNLPNPLHVVIDAALAHLFEDADAQRAAAESNPPTVRADFDRVDEDGAIDLGRSDLVNRQRVLVTDGRREAFARVTWSSLDEDDDDWRNFAALEAPPVSAD